MKGWVDIYISKIYIFIHLITPFAPSKREKKKKEKKVTTDERIVRACGKHFKKLKWEELKVPIK